ncbi:Alkaline phosphatase [Ceratocystis lukuohia]|uniref:alkaline phosphatase n=1 Tax=Ceratocystis lukuohia TaxID=2019550 RepID=A0ABR4MLC7_9PEZI
MTKLTSLTLLASASLSAAQNYRRLADFLPGQYFHLRFEVYTPLYSTETFHNGVPDEAFTTTIRKVSEEVARPISEFFPTEEPELEMWQFGWYEDRFARAAESKSIVNVASKIYRRIHIKDPGEYEVTPTYYNGETTVAHWVVRPISSDRKAKNVILFIGDDQILNGITKYTRNEYVGPEVFLGGGAEAFLLGDISYLGQDYYKMTSNAIEITHARSQEKGGDKGFFLMIEASSIDKQMHALDYDWALGDLLDLDDTISKTMEQLNKMGILDETEIIFTADHGHDFDVFDSADTEYLAAAETDR